MSAQSFPATGLIQGYQVEELLFGPVIAKGPLTLPQSTTSTLYTVAGGAILVTGFLGLVTTAIGTGCNLSIGTVPSAGTAESSGIATATAIGSLAAGTWIAMPATPGAAGASLSAPAVPLSGVPVTNNYHGTVQVVVSGGTLTGVLVGGVTVGAGDGTYQVPMHETIAWTGSLAPTWTWSPSTLLQTGAGGAVNFGKEHVISAGTITWTTSASVTGAIKWYLSYIPLDSQPGDGIAGVGAPVS